MHSLAFSHHIASFTFTLFTTMFNIYVKNYAIWLGGALVLNFFLIYTDYSFPTIVPTIVGVILGTVFTQKELGKNIEFGKAVFATLSILPIFFILSSMYFQIVYGQIEFAYLIEFTFTEIIRTGSIATLIILSVGMWYTFEKAGHPGWAMIIPIYNYVVMCEIAGKPKWWAVLLLLPIVNIIILIILMNEISKSFGKTEGFTVGLVLLTPIFFAILGFGDATYKGTLPKNGEVEDLETDLLDQ